MYKRLYFIGIPAYLFMLLLSVIYAKERIIFLDTSFALFHILKDNSFAIQVYRFGDAFNQLWPLLAGKAGLSLSAVITSYSAGFMAYYFICYLICGSVLKQYGFALTILLLNILFVSDTFYWITSQLPQSIAVLMLTLAFVAGKQTNTTSLLHWFLLVLLVITVAFFHPLLIFVLLYAMLFFALRRDIITDRRFLYVIAALFLAGILVKAIAFSTPYERHSMSGLKNFYKLFPNYVTLFSNKRFLYTCITKYYWIPVIFTGIVSLYIKTRAWKQLVLFISFFLDYLLLINITYPTAETPLFYIESLYIPLGIFLAIPFVFDLLPVLAFRKLGFAIMILIIVSGCTRLWITHETYTARLQWQRDFLATHRDRKAIINAKNANAGILKMLWGTPYEFWLLSTSEQNRTASIIIDDDPGARAWASTHTKSFIVNWNIYEYKELNTKYFHLIDTTSGYFIDTTGR